MRWVVAGDRSLRTATWPAEGDHPAGTVVLLNGRSEFLEKYLEPIAQMRSRGFVVHSLDWHGQGLSQRMLAERGKGHLRDPDHYQEDLRAFLATLPADSPRPVLWLAHSMGAHIALRHLATQPQAADGALLLAPLIAVRWPVPAWLARLVVRSAERLGAEEALAWGQSATPRPPQFTNNAYTGDAERFQLHRWWTDHRPLLHVGGVTWGWLAAISRSMDRLRAPGVAEAVTTPTVLCLAGRERVVDNNAVRRFARRMPRARLEYFTHARHEILFERAPVRDRFWALFDAFSQDPEGVVAAVPAHGRGA